MSRPSTRLREHVGTHAWVRLPAPPDAPATTPDVAERPPLPAAPATARAR